MSRGPSVTQIHPEALNPTALSGAVSVVIPAPGMLGDRVAGGRFLRTGASDHAAVEGLAAPPRTYVTRSVADALSAPAGQLVVLRDLYDALQGVEGDPTAALDTLLARDAGVVLVVSPRPLSWLLDHETLPLDTARLSRVDTVYCLRYRRYRDLPAATEAAQRAAGRALSDADALSTLVCPGFDITAGGVGLETPATLAPGWAGELSQAPDARWLTARGVAQWLDTEATMQVGSLGPAVIPLARSLAEERADTPALATDEAGRVALALVACLQRTGHDPATVTQSLRSLTVTPAARRRLEAAWRVPPDTLTALASLAQRSPRALGLDGAADDDIQVVADVVDAFAAALEGVDSHARPLEELRRLATATAGVDRLARDVRAGRRRLTGGDRRTVDASGFVGPEPDRIREAATEGGVVVVSGPPGTGKTTAIVSACRRLRADGVDTVVPLFGRAEAGTVERAVERSSASVVVAAFGGHTEYGFEDPDRLWRLLTWLDRGSCETVVLEVRASHRDVLAGTIDDAVAGGVDTTPWHDRTVVECGNGDRLPAVAEAALGALGADASPDRRDRVAAIAGERPDVAWLAAGYVATEDRSLAGIENGRALARADCSPDRAGSGPTAADLVGVLASLGAVTTAQLQSVLGTRTLRATGREASESLGGDAVDALRTGASLSGVTWVVRPGLVADTVFRQDILQVNDSLSPSAARFGTLLDRIAAAGSDRHYLALAWRLVTEHAVARRRGDTAAQRRVRRAVDLLLSRLTGTEPTRFLVVEAVVLGEVPVDKARLDGMSDTLVTGSVARATRREATVPEWAAAERLLGVLVATTVDRPGESLLSLLDDVATRFERVGLEDRAAFVAGVYAGAIRRLAARQPDPEAVRASLTATLRSLQTAAASLPAGERSQVVAMALGDALARTVAARPPASSVWPDVVLDAATDMLGPAALSTTMETALLDRPEREDDQWLGWLLDRLVEHTVAVTDPEQDPGSTLSEGQRAAAVETLTGLVTDATVVVGASGEVSTVAGAVGPLADADPALFSDVVSTVARRLAAGDVTRGLGQPGVDPADTAESFILEVYPAGIEHAASGDQSASFVADLLEAGVETVDGEAEQSLLARTIARLFGTDDAEAVATAAVDRLSEPGDALYDHGLDCLLDRRFDDAAGAFGTIWEHRPPDDHPDRPTAEAAGILYVAARVAAGRDAETADVLDSVQSGALPDPVDAVAGALTTDSRMGDPLVDRPLAPEDSADTERRACAVLLDAIDVTADAIARREDSRETSLPTDLTPAAGYRASLRAWASAPPQVAFRTARRRCRAVWEQRTEHDDRSTVQRAGVLWAAHLSVLADDDAAAAEALGTVVPALVAERAHLSAPLAALLEWVQTGQYSSPGAPTGDTSGSDTPDAASDSTLAAAEHDAVERFVDAVAALDTVHVETAADAAQPATAAGSVDDDVASDVLTDYADGLSLVADGEFVAAVDPLLEAWDARDDASPEQAPYALAAGVAVAVLVRDDPVLSLADSQVVSTVGPRVDELPPAAERLFEALRDGPGGTSIDAVARAADPLPGDVDAPVGDAFAKLLSSLST